MGLIHGIVIFNCDNHYRPTIATWAYDLCTFSGCLMGKIREKSDKVSHNMTQIASVLAVTTTFISLWTLISRQRRGGLYVRQKYLCRNLSRKCVCVGGRGLICEGGIIAGFYGTS